MGIKINFRTREQQSLQILISTIFSTKFQVSSQYPTKRYNQSLWLVILIAA